jgi:hypothetical protein
MLFPFNIIFLLFSGNSNNNKNNKKNIFFLKKYKLNKNKKWPYFSKKNITIHGSDMRFPSVYEEENITEFINTYTENLEKMNLLKKIKNNDIFLANALFNNYSGVNLNWNSYKTNIEKGGLYDEWSMIFDTIF